MDSSGRRLGVLKRQLKLTWAGLLELGQGRGPLDVRPQLSLPDDPLPLTPNQPRVAFKQRVFCNPQKRLQCRDIRGKTGGEIHAPDTTVRPCGTAVNVPCKAPVSYDSFEPFSAPAAFRTKLGGSAYESYANSGGVTVRLASSIRLTRANCFADAPVRPQKV